MSESFFKGIKHSSQRVGVFMDVQNMYYSARHLYNTKVDFGEVLKTAVADRNLIRAIAYVVRATGEEGSFFEALNHRGFETKERDMQTFLNGVKKADWDVGITVDAIRIAELLDVVVLITGDGDFVELVQYLKHHGRQVEVVAFRKSTSSRLIEAADDFIDLSQDPDRYLIKRAKYDGDDAAQSNPEPRTSYTPRRSTRPDTAPDDSGTPKGFFGPDAE